MKAPTIAGAALVAVSIAAAALVGCGTAPNLESAEPRPVQIAQPSVSIASNAGVYDDDAERPPKGCRGGRDDGAAARWVLEFRQGGSRLQTKGWTHTWREWIADLEMNPKGQRPMTCRVRVSDNWTVWLEFRRDGKVIASERLLYERPCVYGHRDREDNVYLFYRKG